MRAFFLLYNNKQGAAKRWRSRRKSNMIVSSFPSLPPSLPYSSVSLCVSPFTSLRRRPILPPSFSLALPPPPPSLFRNVRVFPRFWPFCASCIGCAVPAQPIQLAQKGQNCGNALSFWLKTEGGGGRGKGREKQRREEKERRENREERREGGRKGAITFLFLLLLIVQ